MFLLKGFLCSVKNVFKCTKVFSKMTSESMKSRVSSARVSAGLWIKENNMF